MARAGTDCKASKVKEFTLGRRKGAQRETEISSKRKVHLKGNSHHQEFFFFKI